MSPGKLSVIVSCSKFIGSQQKFPVFISHRKVIVIESSLQECEKVVQHINVHTLLRIFF